MAIVVTAKVLGAELGIARPSVPSFALVIGAIMHLLYRHEGPPVPPRAPRVHRRRQRPSARRHRRPVQHDDRHPGVRQLGQGGKPGMDARLRLKWPITAVLAILLAALLVRRWRWSLQPLLVVAGLVAASAVLRPGPELAMVIGIGGLMLQASRENAAGREWVGQSWDFTKQIMPLLLGGVMVAGMLLGRPGHEGLIPSQWVVWAVGDNSFASTLLASLLGAFMYFSTLTEVPIVEGLLGAGMGKGPALAILLAGPALSLPNMLVIRTLLPRRRWCTLVVVMATTSGYLYGQLM